MIKNKLDIFSYIQINEWMRISKDTKKEFHLMKGTGWYWSDRNEIDNILAWHGPFEEFTACLYDAVEPYLENTD